MTVTATIALASVAVLTVQSQEPPDTAVNMAEIVVTGTRSTAQARLEQSAAISLVLPTIESRAASAVAVDLLRDLPGVYVQQTSAGQGAVILRGLVGNQVLYLVDGVPLNNGTYRDGPGQYLATIDPELIERIEIIRGPASVLYGSDAQGGVVNIITKSHSFAGARSVRASANGSTANMGYRTRISAGAVGANWSLAAGGTALSSDDLRAGDGLGEQTPTAYDALGLDFGFTFEPSAGHVIEAVGQHFRMDNVPRFDRYVDFRPPAAGSDAEHVFDPQTRQLGYLRYALTPSTGVLSRLETTVSLSMQREGRSRVRLLDSGVSDSIRTTWRDDAYTPGVSVVGTSNADIGDRMVSFTWGGEFYHDRLESRGAEENMTTGAVASILRTSAAGSVIATGNFPDGANGNRLGIFLAGEAYLLPEIRLEVGARWSRFRNEADVGVGFGGRVENSSSDLTGQVGIVATPMPQWRVALRLAEGFRAPNLYDLTRVGPVPGGMALPNPDAAPERSLSVDLGVRYLTKQGAVSVTVYRTRVTDFIDRRPGRFQGDTLFNGERVFQGLNVGVARIVGVEAEAVRRLGPVQARVSMLYAKGDQEGEDGVDEPMSKIPPLNGSASVRWSVPGYPLWVDYVVRWAARQDRLGARDLSDPRIPEDGTPGYLVQGIRAATELRPRVSLSVGLENLTDELYRTHASGVDGPGRHIWVGVSATGVL